MATKRLIDANKVLEKADEVTFMGFNAEERKKHFMDLVSVILDCVTVDAVEVVHGRWEPRKDVPGFVRCSVCRDCNIYDDWPDGKKWNYCPNCGADMRNGDLNEPATSG